MIVNPVVGFITTYEVFEAKVLEANITAKFVLYNSGGYSRRCEWTVLDELSELPGHYFTVSAGNHVERLLYAGK
jgi:hypothetical protein